MLTDTEKVELLQQYLDQIETAANHLNGLDVAVCVVERHSAISHLNKTIKAIDRLEPDQIIINLSIAIVALGHLILGNEQLKHKRIENPILCDRCLLKRQCECLIEKVKQHSGHIVFLELYRLFDKGLELFEDEFIIQLESIIERL